MKQLPSVVGTACGSTWKPGPALPLRWWRGWEETLSGLSLGAEDLFKKSFGGERWTRQIKLP